MPVHLVPDPVECVVRGAGLCLDSFDSLRPDLRRRRVLSRGRPAPAQSTASRSSATWRTCQSRSSRHRRSAASTSAPRTRRAPPRPGVGSPACRPARPARRAARRRRRWPRGRPPPPRGTAGRRGPSAAPPAVPAGPPRRSRSARPWTTRPSRPPRVRVVEQRPAAPRRVGRRPARRPADGPRVPGSASPAAELVVGQRAEPVEGAEGGGPHRRPPGRRARRGPGPTSPMWPARATSRRRPVTSSAPGSVAGCTAPL